MRTDQFYIFSHLGHQNFIFDDEEKAIFFFENFIGNVMLMKGGKEIRTKQSINDVDTLIHAGLFVQHGIIKDEYNTIDERFLKNPSKETIDYYKEAIKLFSTPGNGLGLFGNSGTGKTTLMRFLNMAAKGGYINGKPFENVKIYDIIKHFKTDGLDVIRRFKLDDESRCNICIDDLGRDKGERKQYGDVINIVGEIIQTRYDCLKEHGLITHFTTNCSPEEIQDLYDPPKTDDTEESRQFVIWGRMCEMTNSIVIEGPNHRLNKK